MFAKRRLSIARQLVAAINTNDADTLLRLCAPDVRFIDSQHSVIEGADAVIRAVGRLPSLDAKHQLVIEDLHNTGNDVRLTGYTTANDARLAGRCQWRATIVKGKVREWQVYRAESGVSMARLLSDNGYVTRQQVAANDEKSAEPVLSARKSAGG
ncbi:hypothetical protein HME9302_00722 [Alteripontixanthobacter maritimus]|uniref:SnoaL-like domain-containing protein n=1 Tax=Alteripontixanthobacter maritimus TaxID=2161824 RepID=A0A369Q4X6_9SPHN|nr:nuclear transport factor 2 family protein [Alteripontixanthobacter maritimus]RDC59532.1 hypothetical protein HME9302_00722 [Alteripontixanthobacter maritimus]